MKPARVLRVGLSMAPVILAAVAAAAPVPGYNYESYLAVAFVLFLTTLSVWLHSDRFYFMSFGVGASSLALNSTAGGPLASFAVVAGLLFLLDIAWLARSLFGIVEMRSDPKDAASQERYSGLLRAQARLSSGLALMTFAVALVAVYAPLPILSFANPVSGSGLLALAALLLVALAGAESDGIADILRPKKGPSE